MAMNVMETDVPYLTPQPTKQQINYLMDSYSLVTFFFFLCLFIFTGSVCVVLCCVCVCVCFVVRCFLFVCFCLS